MKQIQKKAQIGLADAPKVVLIVGFVFLLMATVAYISTQLQTSLGSTTSVTVANETLGPITEINSILTGSQSCNFAAYTLVYVTNQSRGYPIAADNYTKTTNGMIIADTTGFYNNSYFNVSYSYTYSGAACNVTRSLNTNIDNNTSIAGITLTIALVGIVLAILIGVFVLVGRRRA